MDFYEEDFDDLYGDELDVLRSQEDENIPPAPVPQTQHEHNAVPVVHENITSNNSQLTSLNIGNAVNHKRGLDVSAWKEIQLPKPKKLKLHNEIDPEQLAMLEHISEIQKQRFHRETSSKKDHQLFTENLFDILSMRIPSYPFTAMTTVEGLRLYVKTLPEDSTSADGKFANNITNKSEMFPGSEDIWREAQELLAKSRDRIQELDENNMLSSRTLEEPSNHLWTDTYKARKFLDLVSDVGVNTVLLKWMKLWDKVVFHRPTKFYNKTKLAASRLPGMLKKNPKSANYVFELDVDNSPKLKFVLLCGPPGLGKTTMAHLIALHCGYNPIEVNASNDRTVEAFKQILDRGTTMTSVLDKDRRPNCLIFDEIDGAPPAAIDYLVKFSQGQTKSQKRGNKSSKPKREEDEDVDNPTVAKNGNKPKRPIICICNNAYVPALRVLRQSALILRCPPIKQERITQRLSEICEMEKLKITGTGLSKIVEYTQGDIRNALSFLQYLSAQKQVNKTLTLDDIMKTNVPQKDTDKGYFDLLTALFLLPTSNKEKSRHLIKSAMSSCDLDKFAMGIHENFIKLETTNLEEATKALDIFVDFDLLQRKIKANQSYQLFAYQHRCFDQWHLCFTKNANKRGKFKQTGSGKDMLKLTYPSANSENYNKKVLIDSTLADLFTHVRVNLRPFLTWNIMKLDILPMFKSILNPNLRAVDYRMYTTKEKLDMQHLVNTMLDYGLNYLQGRSLQGNYQFNLDPNIEMMSFPSAEADGTQSDRSLIYTARHMVARSIETERLRRYERAQQEKRQSTLKALNDSAVKVLNKSIVTQNLPNHLVELTPKKIVNRPAARDTFSFFKITPRANEVATTTPKFERVGIYFHFNEGHTNAVKRTIKISSLL